MKIEEKFEIAMPIERMYQEINDIGQIGWCIAGVKDVKVTSDTESEWKIEVRAGFMARSFNLKGQITERRPPDYLGFSGRGQDLEITGHLGLTRAGLQATQCEVVVDVTVTGPFASVVDLMAKNQQRQLIQQTIGNVKKKLETSVAGEKGATSS